MHIMCHTVFEKKQKYRINTLWAWTGIGIVFRNIGPLSSGNIKKFVKKPKLITLLIQKTLKIVISDMYHYLVSKFGDTFFAGCSFRQVISETLLESHSLKLDESSVESMFSPFQPLRMLMAMSRQSLKVEKIAETVSTINLLVERVCFESSFKVKGSKTATPKTCLMSMISKVFKLFCNFFH